MNFFSKLSKFTTTYAVFLPSHRSSICDIWFHFLDICLEGSMFRRPDSKNALHISAPNKTAPHKNETNNNAPNENAPIVNLHLYEIIFKNTMKAQLLFDI